MGKMLDGNERNYQVLAAAIVEAAAADYVDAQIINIYGYISYGEFRRKMFKAVIAYGATRYLRVSLKKELVRQDERKNMRKLTAIQNKLMNAQRSFEAKANIKELEEFFRSGFFNILMPNTSGEEMIRLLKEKALKKERIRSIYSGTL